MFGRVITYLLDDGSGSGRGFDRCGLGGFSLSRGCGSSLGIGVNFGEVSADLDNVSLFGEVLSNNSGVSGEDIDGDLISLNSGNDFVSCGEFSNVYAEHGVSTTISLTFNVGLDDSLTDGVSHARDLLDSCTDTNHVTRLFNIGTQLDNYEKGAPTFILLTRLLEFYLLPKKRALYEKFW